MDLIKPLGQESYAQQFQNIRQEMTDVMNSHKKLSGAKLMMLCAQLISVINNFDNYNIKQEAHVINGLSSLQKQTNAVKQAFANIQKTGNADAFKKAIEQAKENAEKLKKDPAFKSESAQTALTNYESYLDGASTAADKDTIDAIVSGKGINGNTKTAGIQTITQDLSSAESQVTNQSAAVNSKISTYSADISQCFNIEQSYFSNRSDLAKKILAQPA